MEKRDLELIEKYVSVDDELRKCVEEHGKFEKLLGEFSKRIHLTPEDEMKQKGIKKLKLKGRDKIEQILAKYRQQTADM
jgi:hypothetical protein